MYQTLKRAAKMLSGAKKILIFTGPGISAASGIPCASKAAAAEKVDAALLKCGALNSGGCGKGFGAAPLPQGFMPASPVSYNEFIASTRAKLEYWKFLHSVNKIYTAARPNAAHLALAEFERKGRVLALATQNEDNLHRLAGSGTDRLIELHGSCLYAECLDCFDWLPMNKLIENFRLTGCPPMCSCGGWLKPSALMPGELPEREALIKGFKAARECDLVISIGSSLTARPSSDIPLAAKAAGKPYIIINQSITAHDKAADIKLNADALSLLPELL